MITPSPSYSQQNEAQFRASVEQSDKQSVKRAIPEAAILLLDQTDGSAYRVEVIAGVLTATQVTP